jgi:hypothetical protein
MDLEKTEDRNNCAGIDQQQFNRSTNHTNPGLSAAVLRSNTQQHQQPQPPSVAQACPPTVEEISATLPFRHNQQVPSQSVQAPKANSSSLNDMFTAVAKMFQ